MGAKALTHFFRSGCRESNSGCMTPSHAYYHYTTARSGDVLVRAAGLESSERADSRDEAGGEIDSFCRAAGNRTRSLRTRIVRTTGILRPDKRNQPNSHVLPKYYGPNKNITRTCIPRPAAPCRILPRLSLCRREARTGHRLAGLACWLGMLRRSNPDAPCPAQCSGRTELRCNSCAPCRIRTCDLSNVNRTL